MKRCPTCQSTYTDDSLRFCLQDGTQLLGISGAPRSHDIDATLLDQVDERPGHDPPPTEVLDARVSSNLRPPTSAPSELAHPRPTRQPEHRAQPIAKSSGSAMKAAMIALAALFLLTSIVLGIALWRRSSSSSQNIGNAGANSIRATASSTRQALAGNTYDPDNVLDGRLMTAWAEGVEGAGVGEWIRCDFNREVTLQRISIAPGYFKSPQIWARNNRLAAATFYFSDGTSRQFRFPDRMEEQMLEVGGVRTSWVRIVIREVYGGEDSDTSISQLAFEWEQ